MTVEHVGLFNPPTCATCGGLLVLSAYGGYLHDDDSNDTHTPVVTPGRHKGG